MTEMSASKVTQTEFYQRLVDKQYVVVKIADMPGVLVAKVCWEDVYAIGVQPAREADLVAKFLGLVSPHKEAVEALGMFEGQTALVMKKALVAVTPLPGGKFDARNGGDARG